MKVTMPSALEGHNEGGLSGMRPEDIGSLRRVEGPRVSPDGSRVAFTVVDVDLEANRYRRRIWLAAVDAGAPPRVFSAGPDDQLPRWSPDGAWLAFAVNPDEGVAQLCVLPAAQPGERITVCQAPDAISELAWSPDGSRLAFLARSPDPERYGPPGQRRRALDMPARRVTRLFSRLDSEGWVVDRPTQLFVVPADGSSPPLAVTSGPYQCSGLAWSPDGTRLAFASARHDTWDLDLAVDLWAVAADGTTEPERLTATGPAYGSPSWSPDGRRLAYLCQPSPEEEPRHSRVGALDLTTGATYELTELLDRNCDPYGYGRAPVWCGANLLFSVEDGGANHVYSMPVAGDGKPEPVVSGDRWVTGWDWAGGALAMAISTPTTFPELVTRPLPAPSPGGGTPAMGEAERRLTNLTAPFRARRALGEPVAYSARSEDGTEVPCWAIPPIGAVAGRRYPTLLNVHGGPFASYGQRFFDEFQLQAGAGFGVLYCNPRGSSGYAESWGRAVRWPQCANDPGSGWGGVDFEDVMACAEEGLRRFDWADPERVGIIGGSYGGYMTSWALGHTDLFKAGCSERACNNLLSLETGSDTAGAFRTYVGVTHLEDPEAYLRHSPISYVTEIRAPVLILHSEDDLRCPVSQAEELFVALRLLGRQPVFVRFPGESHELSRSGAPRHRVERAQVVLEWFELQLGNKGRDA